MPLTQIRYFYEVARTGSIREASSRLNVTPSSVSRQIQNLEHEVSTPLFERRARGMTLTSAGEIYMKYARSVLVELDRVHSDIDALKGLRSGHVRIHAVTGIAETLIEAISTFRTRYPGVTFELTASDADAIAAAIQSVESDIGVTFNSESHIDVRVAFSVADPLYVIAHPSSPVAKLKKIKLAEAVTYPFAVSSISFSTRKLINQCCAEQRIRLRPTVVTNSGEALRAFVRVGAGLTILPLPSVAADIASKRMVAVPLTDRLLMSSSFDVCVSADRKLPVSASEFLKHLEVHFSKNRKIVHR